MRANSLGEEEMYVRGLCRRKLILPFPLPRDDVLRGDASPKLLLGGVCAWEARGAGLRSQNGSSCGGREQMCAGAVFVAEDSVGNKGRESRWGSYSTSLRVVPSLLCSAVKKDRPTPPFSPLQLRLYGCIGDT